MEYRIEELDRVRLFVKVKAMVSLLTPDGEVIDVYLPPGFHRIGEWAQWLPAGTTWTVDGAWVAQRNGRGLRVPYGPGHFETGANPDFRPRRMTDGEAELHRIVKGLQSQIKEVRTAARVRAVTGDANLAEEHAQVEEQVLEQPEEQADDA